MNISALSNHMSPSEATEGRKLHQACDEFEAVFIHQLFRVMRQSVDRNQLFSGGRAEEMFQDMQDGEVAESIAGSGNGLGLSDMLYRQLATQLSPGAASVAGRDGAV